jgi:hypothetical protein
VLLGEIKGDRKRFPENKAVVIDCRQPLVGIDREIVRLARAGRPDLDRDVLERKAELLCDPDSLELSSTPRSSGRSAVLDEGALA